jgi:hypothetical protein
MHLGRFAHVWIVLHVAVALLLAPLAAPVMATAMPQAAKAVAQAMSMPDDMSTAEDMPCCPGETKSKACDSCPFVALCMLSVPLPDPSGAATLIERAALRTAFAPTDDQLIDGLGAKPPDHPPRIMI